MRTLKKKGSSRSSMSISMSDVIFVTNRKLCREDFLTRIERLAQSCPKAVILREKDLSPEEYTRLAAKVMEICRARGTLCILHTFADTAEKLHAAALHLSMDGLRKLDHQQRKKLSVLGASCHSAAEASEAEALGCTYITAGHIFNTDCKAGVPGRGTDFLKQICSRVSIPVYAIGGIDPANAAAVREAGAAGICVMSAAMTCADPSALSAALGGSPENRYDRASGQTGENQ